MLDTRIENNVTNAATSLHDEPIYASDIKMSPSKQAACK
jgi:hypothetical protein